MMSKVKRPSVIYVGSAMSVWSTLSVKSAIYVGSSYTIW